MPWDQHGDTYLLALRCPVCRRRDFILALEWNVRTCSAMPREKYL